MKKIILMISALFISFSLTALSERSHHSRNFKQEGSHSKFQGARDHSEIRSRNHFRTIEEFKNHVRSKEHYERRKHGGIGHHFQRTIIIPIAPQYYSDCCYWDGGVCGCNRGATVCCNGEIIPDCNCY